MVDAGTYGPRFGDSEDGWGPATSFRSSTPAAGAASATSAPAGPSAPSGRSSGARVDDRDVRRDHSRRTDRSRTKASADARSSAMARVAAAVPTRVQEHERGVRSWLALCVLVAIAGIGAVIDLISGTEVRAGFNIGIIVASVVAILVVRRSGMFPVVIAPPIVYSLFSGITLYVRSGGLDDRKVLIDSAANWLVYGFPAIAAATAAVLIIAGLRMILRK